MDSFWGAVFFIFICIVIYKVGLLFERPYKDDEPEEEELPPPKPKRRRVKRYREVIELVEKEVKK